jgi:hypothetical protein
VTLSANILFSLVANETDAGDYAKDVRTTRVEYFKELTDGTGANQASLAWSDSGAFDELVNTTGVGFTFSDERGSGSFSAIKLIYIRNVGDINLLWVMDGAWPNGPVSSAQGGSEMTIKPGGALLYFAPDAVGWPTTGGQLRLACEPETIASYEVILIGEGTIT